jgi:hypothetical protein
VVKLIGFRDSADAPIRRHVLAFTLHTGWTRTIELHDTDMVSSLTYRLSFADFRQIKGAAEVMIFDPCVRKSWHVRYSSKAG